MGFIFTKLNDFKNRVRDAKDSAIADNLRAFINTKIREFGTMVDLKIDSQAKNIYASFNLEGETSAINLAIYGYSIVKENNESYLSFNDIDTNREWLSKLVKTVIIPHSLPNKRIKIDPKIASLVKIIL